MIDRPIFMIAPMVRALLDGTKTQTRRLAWSAKGKPTVWQKAQPGDRLWVRETWAPVPHTGSHDWDSTRAYRADRTLNPEAPWAHDDLFRRVERWRPSIHMPRWASRLTLVVTEVQRQRLQDITCADAIAEGCAPHANSLTIDCDTPSPRDDYKALWNSLHGVGAWDENPEVVVLSFTIHQANIDQIGEEGESNG